MQSSERSHTTKAPSHFFFMNVLRVYAAFMIVLIHAYSVSQQFLTTPNAIPFRWFSVIGLFFTMSGFLIIHMGRKLYGSRKGIPVFLSKRSIRILPVYWIYTAFAILIFLMAPSLDINHRVTLESVITSFLFFPTIHQPVILLGWTLNLEVFFYVLFALSLLFPFPRGPIVLCAILALLVTVGKLIALPLFALRFWTDPLLIDFIWGIAVALFYQTGLRLSFFQRGLLLLAAIVIILTTSNHFQYGDMVRPFTFGLASALLVAAATLREYDPDFGKADVFITELSNSTYTLYLSHIFSLKFLELLYLKLAISNPYMFMLTGIPFAFTVAYAAYRLLEKPLTEYLRTKVPHA